MRNIPMSWVWLFCMALFFTGVTGNMIVKNMKSDTETAMSWSVQLKVNLNNQWLKIMSLVYEKEE